MKAISEFESNAKAKRGWAKGSKYSRRPRRPLTSYNIFFSNERKKIIREQQQGQEQGSEDQAPRHVQLWFKVSNAGRGRAHIGFAGLAQYVSQKWKTVSKSYKTELEELARLDKIRYDKEMTDWRFKLKFDEDLAQGNAQDKMTSKFDDSCMKIEEENKKNPVQQAEAYRDVEGTLPFLTVFPEGNPKVLSRGMQEYAPADIKESFTYTHQESPKCLVKSDYKPLPFQSHWVSFNPDPSISSMMDSTIFSRSPSENQHVPSVYLCHPCNTTDPSNNVFLGLSTNTGEKIEMAISSSSLQYGYSRCNAFCNQEEANFSETNMPMSHDHVRTVPSVTAGSSRSMGTMENFWDQGSSFDRRLEGFNYSNDCEESLRDYSLQDIQRFFGIDPESQEK